MAERSNKQKLRRLKKALEAGQSVNSTILDTSIEVLEAVENLAEAIPQQIDISDVARKSDVAGIPEQIAQLSEELKKKSEYEFVYEIDRDKLRGEPGKDASVDDVVARVLPVVLGKVPTADEIAKFVPVDIVDEDAMESRIRSSIKVPTPQVIESKETATGIADKLNTLESAVDFKVLKNVPDFSAKHTKETVIHRGGVTRFRDLTDTPNSFAGASGKIVAVKTDESALEFVDAPSGGTWGSITGTLSAQTDLQTALNLKAGLADNNTWAGTQTFSQMTSGSIAYFGANGLLSQDNANFYWHDVSKQLDVYSSLSTELLTNPNFTGSTTGWSVGSGWAYSSNSVSKTSNGTAALSQSGSFVAGEEFIVSFVISALTVGSVTVTGGGITLATVSANGTYTYRIIATGSGVLAFTPTNTARLTVDTVSVKRLSGGSIRTGELNLFASHSNYAPGTTRMQRFDNSGSGTWTEYRFSGTLRSALGATNSGNFGIYTSGSNGLELYSGGSGLGSNTMYGYMAANQVVFNQAWAGFQGGVHAGASSTPSTTLQSAGAVATKVKRVTINQTLDNTASTWLGDASTATCTGTPATSCSAYTNSTDCNARDAHGGCVWNAGTNCNVYNGDQSQCTAQSGCTWETASCSGFGDETTCNSYSGCSWDNNPQSCSVYDADESTCNSTMGCTWNYTDCSSSFFDESSCNAQSGCSWDGMTCLGTYNTSCSGSYDSYSCNGSYSTGNCTGTFGANCSGTASCASIDDSTNCGAETGCTWSTAVTFTLPSVLSAPDRHYWIFNDSSTGADVVVNPASGDTIDKTTSYTLSSYKDAIHIQPFADIRSCTVYNADQSTCASTSGCTAESSFCSWIDGVCSGNAACDGVGDEGTCTATTYFSGCSGSYYASKNWYVLER